MKRFIITLCLISLAFAACDTNEVMDYQLPDKVYFHEYNIVSTVERPYYSKNFSFAIQSSTLMDTIIQIRVQLMGQSVDRDRIFRAQIIQENSTAQANKHYKLLDGILKAGDYYSYLPVEIYRTEDTKEESVHIELELIDTEDLQTGNANALKFTLTWGDILLQPTNWPYYWGNYNANKYKFAIDILGQSDWPAYDRYTTWYVDGYFTVNELQSLAVKLNAAYQEYKSQNGPIYNSDSDPNSGEIMFAVGS